MDDSGGKMIRQYLLVLRRRWWVIFLIVAVASASALVVSERMTPIYVGQAQINVTPFTSPGSSSAVLNLLTDPTAALQTDVTLIESAAVIAPVAKPLGTSATTLQNAISAKVLTGTQIIDVQASSPVPAQAQSWANAVANAFITFEREQAILQVTAASAGITQQISSLQGQLNAAGSSPTSATMEAGLTSQITTLQGELDTLPAMTSIVTGGGSVIATATLPMFPSSPKKTQNVLLGVVVGLLLAIGLVLLIEALDDRLRSAEEIESRSGAPSLGSVPYTRDLSKSSGAATVVHQTTSAVAEAYRTLRTNLRFLSVECPLRTLLVTSSVKGEGKSTTAANLAAAFAVSGVRTILVSADLRRPSVHRFFGLQNSVGVVDAVLPNVALEGLLQTNELPHLRVLAAGRVPPNPTEILSSARFAEILEVLSSAADLVIVDSPPLLGVADASALASRVDGVLLVVNPGEANRRSLEHAVAQLHKAGGRLLGTVMNAVGPGTGYGYGYDYDYYYAEEKDNRKARKKQEKVQEKSEANRANSANRGKVKHAHKEMPEPSVSAGAGAERPSARGSAAATSGAETEPWLPLAPDRGHETGDAPDSNGSGNGSLGSHSHGTPLPSSLPSEGPRPAEG
jgi:capsular exopolysaccharide synthesis family protein